MEERGVLLQIIHDFGISPEEYHKRGKWNDFPEIKRCPLCLHPKRLRRHSFYWRNAVFFYGELRIPILRLKCLSCDKTFSILPDFLLPYFQYSLQYILELLREYFLRCKSRIYYQLLQFYRRRFLKNLNRIEAFFRDQGFREIIPEKEKAIKLLKMIRTAFPKAETFAKRFQEHFHHNFMAI